MAWVNAVDTVWVVPQYVGIDTFWDNNLYFESTIGAWDRPRAHQLASDIGDWAQGQLLPNIAEDVGLSAASATDMSSEFSFTEFVTYTPNPMGLAGEGMPYNLCFQVYFTLATPVAGVQGSNNISGLPRSAVAGPYVLESYATVLVEVYTNLLAVAAANDCTWVVCSRHTGGADRATAVNYPITGVTYHGLDVSTWRQRSPNRHS